MPHIKNSGQVMTGIFLILVALLAFYLSWRFRTFSEIGIGVGFVPRMFASVQVLLGILLIVSGFLSEGERGEDTWQLRPLIVLAAIIYFGVTIERMGLVISVVGLVLISCSANRDTRFLEALALAVASAAFAVLVFVKALSLTIPIWPVALGV